MTESDKAAERSMIILQLGRVLAPLDALAERAAPPTIPEYQVALATLLADSDRWENEVSKFVIIGGIRFANEYSQIVNHVVRLRRQIDEVMRCTLDSTDRQTALKGHLETCKRVTIEAIGTVPIQWTARLHAAQSPFKVHLSIWDAMGTAKHRIHYFDRYLAPDFYRLYMRDLNRSVEVRLVTTRGNANYGTTSVLAVSRLAAGEFKDYKLVECSPADMHDRNLRIDDRVFFLGPSINNAGTYPTNFSPADSTAHGHAVVNSIMAKGAEIT